MKPKIILKRILHRNEWRYAIIFKYDKKLTGLVRSVDKATWSQTNLCWYANASEATLKQIFLLFRDHADIDISQLVTTEKFDPVTDTVPVSIQKDKVEAIPKEEDDYPQPDESLSPSDKSPSGSFISPSREYDPVLFTIDEAEGNLIIRFTGRYNPSWIEEMKIHGKMRYLKMKREWMLSWSLLTVDSLSDYFSQQGVEVIVKRSKVSPVLKEIRDDQGGDIRSRLLSEKAIGKVELLRNYLEEKRYSKRTIESYVTHLELFFKYFNKHDPEDLTIRDISDFIENHIIKLGYSSSYQNLVISSIKIFYSLSGRRRVKLEAIERPRRSRALPKVFSKDEVMKIFTATRNSKHKLMLWLIYSCGLRRSEVTKIKLTDLDKERGILHIREGKGNVDRMVPVPGKVWEKIKEYLKGYNPKVYLFEGQGGGKYSVESVYSVFKQSLKRAGIRKDVGVHCLRHSYATHLHESGLDIKYIQELLGHKSTRTTEIYTHVSRRNLFAIRSPIEDMDI